MEGGRSEGEVAVDGGEELGWDNVHTENNSNIYLFRLQARLFEV